MLSRRTRIVLAILVVASLTFVILDLRGGDGPLNWARSATANSIGLVQRAAAAVFGPVTGASTWWSTLRDQSDQISELAAENARLRSEAISLESDRARVAALDALLGVASVGKYTIVPAEVIAVGPAQDFSWAITIDTGARDGIEIDMTVINGDGLVGRVVKTTANTSTVVLVVDSSSAVGGRVALSDEIGIVSGTGRQDSLSFQLLDPTATLKVGDALVTFGSKGGRPYAPGLPIGEVIEVGGTPGQLTRVATLRPYVNVSQLSVVGVVTRPPRVDPRNDLLPGVGSVDPSPTPLPLGAAETATPAPDAPERETAATVQPSEAEE